MISYLAREDPQQAPREIQTLVDRPLLVDTLGDKLVLEAVEELQRELQTISQHCQSESRDEPSGGERQTDLFLGRESLLSDDGLHRLGVLSDSVLHSHGHD